MMLHRLLAKIAERFEDTKWLRSMRRRELEAWRAIPPHERGPRRQNAMERLHREARRGHQ